MPLPSVQLSDPRYGVELTFNVKEVRAFLSYCDSLGDHDVRLRWIAPGQPILLETKLRQSIAYTDSASEEMTAAESMHMRIVVATLSDQSTHGPTPTPQPQNTQASQQQQAAHASQPQMTMSQSFRQKQSAAAPTGEADRVDHANDELVPQTPPYA